MTPREFAIEVVRQLQDTGFQALWAGGCVRDQLLGRSPKDYDVATDATPDQVRELFGKRRTLSIGAAFGVITVIGSRQSGNIEIATFRRDSEYSDGRRPNSVEFTDAREDAIRRDFTINGMFYDPIGEELIDYVEGRADIDCRIIRAIGNPDSRIDEDKLRMLRAVRFAATFDFELDPITQAAIVQHADEIKAVSAERIGAEMRRMLTHQNRATALRLLKDCGLLTEILLDGESLYTNRANWKTRLRWMEALPAEANFEQAASVLLSPLIKKQGIKPTVDRWKLSNSEAVAIQWIENNLLTLTRAHQLPWSTIQPLLIQKDAWSAVQIARVQFGDDHQGVNLCAERLQWCADKLNPKPLIDGADLMNAGIEPGPIFSRILSTVRATQLDAGISTKQQGMKLVHDIAATDGDG